MYKKLADKWLSSNNISEDYKKEIYDLDEKELEDRFYKELEFGTGGLRSIIGSGINRINIYTVGKVTQGYANFLKDKYKNQDISVAIAYDSRNKSSEFAKRAGLIFATNGIKVYLYESLRPTPMLSFALRELKCKGGVVITASHNPKEYNGYKVYGEDGGQLTDELANEVYEKICEVDIFEDINILREDEAINELKLEYIGEEIDRKYFDKVKSLVIRKDLVKNHSQELKIVYTPLHGSGLVPVTKVLDELGYINVEVVKEQSNPDGNFPTVSYPNPELEDVFDLSIKLANQNNSDLILATDPDCDRVGVVSRDKNGEYKFFTGNQIGILLSEYILCSLKEQGKLNNKSTIIKTIVTTDVIKNICSCYGVNLIEVLTGFKYIGEKIKEFESDNSGEYIFGFEESYGYLLGDFVRDKDAVIATNIIAEMTLYYKKNGKTLCDALECLYSKYGFSLEKLVSMELSGKEGQDKISNCLEKLRRMDRIDIENMITVKVQDYKCGVEKDVINNIKSKIDLPSSNVLKVLFGDGSWFAARPSGTEPKIKFYMSVRSNSKEDISAKMEEFEENVLNLIKKCMD
ncbi:phospho-sugar mutase [Candidatus Arthromitus sp. SFB-rat-Yit]|uniref:phospho-sugar mutase n=1 Tax=Candidatus Arthromitus sp. SFB-rat-Yit TaxID=1041504 RepID=UPI00031C38BC|nr:phospho-sugar mutase [Candidatus Arthromitus sp. SFB-rat-Yit]